MSQASSIVDNAWQWLLSVPGIVYVHVLFYMHLLTLLMIIIMLVYILFVFFSMTIKPYLHPHTHICPISPLQIGSSDILTLFEGSCLYPTS